MANADQELGLKAITKLTGLNEHTLRAWERRYGAIKPRRTDAGRRVYTTKDAIRLQRLVELVAMGHKISKIAEMSDLELAQLIDESVTIEQNRDLGFGQERRIAELELIMEKICATIEAFDVREVRRLLTTSRIRFGAKDFVLHIVQPFANIVGRMLAAGELNVAQEQALEAAMKHQLFSILFAIDGDNRATSLLEGRDRIFAAASPEGDDNEIGLLAASILCAVQGGFVHYVGTNIPAEPLGDVAASLGANHIVINLPARVNPGQRGPALYIKNLIAGLPADMLVWVVGPWLGTDGFGHQAVRHFPSLEALEQEM